MECPLGLAETLAGCIRDWRDPALVVHTLSAMLRFRMFAIACGYEDADFVLTVTPVPGLWKRAILNNFWSEANQQADLTFSPPDTAAPQVVSIARQDPSSSPTNANSLTWRVPISEDVQNVNGSDFAVADTTATLAAVAVKGLSAAYDVTASRSDLAALNGMVTLSFPVGQNIADTAINALKNTAPGFVSAAVNGTSLVPTYSEDLDAVSVPGAGAFEVQVDGSAAALVVRLRTLTPDK